MQAIITKYLSATNCKGARIKATCARGSITISYPYELSGDARHVAACDALIAKFTKEDSERYQSGSVNPWNTPRVCGELPSGERAHVFPQFGGSDLLIRFACHDDAAQVKAQVQESIERKGRLTGHRAGIVLDTLAKAITVS